MAASNAQDCIERPLAVIDSLFEESLAKGGQPAANWGEREHFINRLGLQDEENFAKIPCLNDVQLLQDVAPFTLVRYRAMVQDVFESEHFTWLMEEKPGGCCPAADGSNRLVTSKYRDFVSPAAGRELHDVGRPECGSLQTRGACYCVPLPGETEWARMASQKWAASRGGSVPSKASTAAAAAVDGGYNAGKKRTRGEDVDMAAGGDASTSGDATAQAAAQRQRNDSTRAATGSQNVKELRSADDFGLNFPLPSDMKPGRGNSTACIVKLYDSLSEGLKICETVEVIGVLCMNPEAADFNERPMSGDDLMQDARNPSTSLVPRLHALFLRRLPFYHPLLPYSPDWLTEARLAAAYGGAFAEAGKLAACWQLACHLLTARMHGDSLAAQYTLLQLVSRTFGQHDHLRLGAWSLGVSGWPARTPMSDLAAALHELCPRVAHLHMTVDNLNGQRWFPRKDEVANRVVAGQLQLSPGTLMLLDETAMTPGSLTADAVKAVKAIDRLVADGHLPCDCSYYEVKLPTEVSCMAVTDQKRSLVQSVSVNVPLKPDATAAAASSKALQDAAASSTSVLEAIRLLMALVTRSPKPLDIPEEVKNRFGEDYASMRQEFAIDQSILPCWLALARACCLWHGEQKLTSERWQLVLSLERDRLRRLREAGLLQASP